MEHNDEQFTSSISKHGSTALVSFVGFQPHLVINFLNKFLKMNVSEVILFSSKVNTLVSKRESTANEKIAREALELISSAGCESIKATIIRLQNIWDFQEYYIKLSEIISERAVINISAGPAVFAAAGMIWALERGHRISYSVEYHNKNGLISSVFTELDLRPFVNSTFSTDNVDSMILRSLRTGDSDTIKIHEWLNIILGYRISLRAVESHLSKLSKLGIVEITKGRVNKVSISENLTKIGYFQKRL